MEVLLALHALATIMMAGLIWFVQLVHYPLFPLVGAGEFVRYEREHTRRVAWIVVPLMGLEAITAVALVLLVDGATMRLLAIAGLLLVTLIWASTAFLQIPCHRKLSAGCDPSVATRLVTTNWLRTLAWTARACLAVVMPTMMQWPTINLEFTAGGLTVDGAKVVTTDLECSNGVIHVIDRVMIPSDKDIFATAHDAGDFKTLIAAVKAANLKGALQCDGPLTVFAPTDEAFAKLPEGTIETLLRPENREKLTSIPKLHVAPGRAFAIDALAAGEARTLQGATVQFRITDGRMRVNDGAIAATAFARAVAALHRLT